MKRRRRFKRVGPGVRLDRRSVEQGPAPADNATKFSQEIRDQLTDMMVAGRPELADMVSRGFVVVSVWEDPRTPNGVMLQSSVSPELHPGLLPPYLRALADVLEDAPRPPE